MYVLDMCVTTIIWHNNKLCMYCKYTICCIYKSNSNQNVSILPSIKVPLSISPFISYFSLNALLHFQQFLIKNNVFALS